MFYCINFSLRSNLLVFYLELFFLSIFVICENFYLVSAPFTATGIVYSNKIFFLK